MSVSKNELVAGQPEAPPMNAGTARRFPTRLRNKWFWGLVAVGLTLVAGLYWYYSGRETTDDAQIDGDMVPISAKISGTVLRVHVNDNQQVQAGDLLVEIDPRDYQVRLEQARAELAMAEAQAQAAQTDVPITSEVTAADLEQAQAAVRRAERELEAAQARLDAAEANLRAAQARAQRAQTDRERMRVLLAKEEVSQQQFDHADALATAEEAALQAAQATVEEARQSLAAIELRLREAQARLRQAETAPKRVQVARSTAHTARARVELARAQVHSAELQLEYTQIRAPRAGVVSKKTVQVGQVVQPGQPLLMLVPLDDVWITANFKETQLTDMRPGQRVIVKVDTYPGKKFYGRVESIAAATGARFSLLPPENATGNFVKVVQRIPVKIMLDKGQDPEHILRPGMSVVPTVITRD